MVAVQKDKEVSVKDLRSPAISVARAIQYRSSHQPAGRFYAAIVLARVARSKGLEQSVRALPKANSGINDKKLPGKFPTRYVFTRLKVRNALNELTVS